MSKHAGLNVKLTIYLSIWMHNSHFILPMPNSILLVYTFLPPYHPSSPPPHPTTSTHITSPPKGNKNSLFLLYFFSFQFLVTSFFRLMPKPQVIFLPFYLTPQIWSVSKLWHIYLQNIWKTQAQLTILLPLLQYKPPLFLSWFVAIAF